MSKHATLVSLLKPISLQLFDDIYNRFYTGFVIKQKANTKEKLDSCLKRFLSSCSNANIGAKLLEKAMQNNDNPSILSGEILIINIIKEVMGSSFESKTTTEILQYGYDNVKILFLQLSQNTVTLYSQCIINQKDKEVIFSYINQETIKYFLNLKKEYEANYGGGLIENLFGKQSFDDKDYKRKYKDKKKKCEELTIRIATLEAQLGVNNNKFNNFT